MMELCFLDFDGCLHPCTAGTFCYAETFEAFLRQYPTVRVVFSTTWREDHSFDDLVSIFSPDVRNRFIGTTPVRAYSHYLRYDEICAWRQEHHVTHLPWVALDDSAELFPPNCQNLVLCETIRGIRPRHVQTMAQRLGLHRG